MSKRFGTVLTAVLVVTGMIVGPALAGPSPDRPPRPGPEYRWVSGHWVHVPAPQNTVWVAGHTGPGGSWVAGHFKYVGPAKPGRVWIPGHWEGDTWVRGYFRLVKRPNRVWVAGHAGPDGRWVRGYWRYAGPPRRGQVWVSGHWDGNVWVVGRWRKTSKRGRVWVPGHRGPHGKWRPGHWKRR